MDAAVVVFGLFSLALGVVLLKKRGSIVKGGKGGGAGGGPKIGIPPIVFNWLVSLLMVLGGTGLAATFLGDWLREMDFSIAGAPSRGVIILLAILTLAAVAFDVLNGNGLKNYTYAMIVLLPLMWAAGDGSLSWPRSISAWAWTHITGIPI